MTGGWAATTGAAWLRRLRRRSRGLTIRHETSSSVQRVHVHGVRASGDLNVIAVQKEWPEHICPDCGYTTEACQAKSSDPNHCWRWDEEDKT